MGFGLEVAVPLGIAASGLFFLWAERRWPYNPGQGPWRPDLWNDLIAYGLIQSYLMGAVISAIIYWLDTAAGHPSRLKLVGHWPLWFQVAFFVITHDLVTYLIHRTQHRVPWLWRFHEAHHSSPDVDWAAGIRSHSGEILLYQTAEYLPVILLGAAPEVPLYKALCNASYGMFIHSNLNWRMGKLLWILNGPELHRWHHANDDSRLYDKNFATKFTVWDRLFGTYFHPGEAVATDYGSTDPHYPRGWWGQHLYALRRRKVTEPAGNF